MKIRTLAYNFNYNLNRKKVIPSFKNIQSSSFAIRNENCVQRQLIELQRKKLAEEYEQFCQDTGKVSFKEFQSIKAKNPTILYVAKKEIENHPHDMETTPNIIAKTAIMLKSYFDKKYGENYRLISIGTSPACIAEAMDALGAKVVYVPLSGINHYENCSPNSDKLNIKNYPNIQSILKYLKSKGVYKESKGKVNILIDYCNSGKSLRTMGELIKQYNKVPKDFLQEHSIITLIKWIAFQEKEMQGILDIKEIAKLEADMKFQRIGEVCNVPHFNICEDINRFASDYISTQGKTQYQLFQTFETYSRPRARAFALCVLDEINK